MAYIDKNKKKFIADRDENQFIGFKLPFELDNGGFNSLTTETLDAVKQNLLNLLNTEMGERVMQPNLGVRIRRYLFEPYRDGVITGIQDILLYSEDKQFLKDLKNACRHFVESHSQSFSKRFTALCESIVYQ